MNTTWKKVTRAAPCPICHKPDWCGVSEDGTAVCCMRIQSDKDSPNGGWIHRTGTPLPFPSRAPVKPLPDALAPRIDADAVWQRFRKSSFALEETAAHARLLKLPPWAVWELGAGIDLAGNLAFPMYDGRLKVCGIRLRSCDGQKWAVKGSRQGVFVATRYGPQEWGNAGHAVVVEGPTDAAAVLALNMIPIGRPSCLGCEETVAEIAKKIGATTLTIVADSDGPGVAGARKLSLTLTAARIRHCLVTAGGYKDMRRWLQDGVTPSAVKAQWAQALWK